MNPLESLSPKELEFALRGELARKAFDIESYAHFHWCVFNKELVRHSKRMVAAMFAEFEKTDRLHGVLNKASRGFTKSIEGAGFMAFVIGHFPYLSHVILAARDKDAKRMGEFLSDLIQINSGWKACFPYVVPDLKRGWSLDASHVIDTRIPYDEWVKKTMDDHGRDPSFVSLTISGGARGLHPTGILMPDDIHDEENTSSRAEKETIKAKVRDDVLPTMSRAGRKPMLLANYTPLSTDDANAEILEGSGLFRLIETPAFVEVPQGNCPNCNAELLPQQTPDNVIRPYICTCGKLLREYGTYENDVVKLTWWEEFTPEILTGWRQLLGRRNFARAYLCDLVRGKTVGLPYYGYEFTGDDRVYEWPMVGGCDPTQFVKESHEDSSKRSHFALAYVAKNPHGGAVIVDGVLSQCSQLDAENFILSAQDKFQGWKHTLVEEAGTGRMFIDTCHRNPALASTVIGSDLYFLDRRGKVKSKEDRFEKDAAKWFENMTVRISTARTPFLDAVRHGLDHFFELDKHSKSKDALDAVYHALKGLPDVLRIEAFDQTIERVPFTKSVNPLAIGQNWRGYGNG